MTITHDLEQVTSGGDAGLTYSAKCPDCKGEFMVAEMQWWTATCGCNGRSWQLSICAKSDDESEP